MGGETLCLVHVASHPTISDESVTNNMGVKLFVLCMLPHTQLYRTSPHCPVGFGLSQLSRRSCSDSRADRNLELPGETLQLQLHAMCQARSTFVSAHMSHAFLHRQTHNKASGPATTPSSQGGAHSRNILNACSSTAV